MFGFSIFEKNKKLLAEMGRPYTRAQHAIYQQLLLEMQLDLRSVTGVLDEAELIYDGKEATLQRNKDYAGYYVAALNEATFSESFAAPYPTLRLNARDLTDDGRVASSVTVEADYSQPYTKSRKIALIAHALAA